MWAFLADFGIRGRLWTRRFHFRLLVQTFLKLQEALHVDDDEQLRFLLEWMINYTPSCTTPDVNGAIEGLIEVSLQLASQRRLTDELAKKFADLMERLLRNKKTGHEDCFLN